MKIMNNFFRILICVSIISCNSENKIIELLNSKAKDDIISGANKAGESGKIKFVPYILKNADDGRISTNFNFKGISVYQAKMKALEKILKTNPIDEITYKPDSAIIKFYISVYEKAKE